MSSSLHAGSVIDQFSTERALRIRLPDYGDAISLGTLGLGATDCLNLQDSISPHDVMAASPNFLAVSPHPMARFPYVVRAAGIISGTAIIRSIADGNHHRASAVIWPRTGAVIRAGAVIRPVARVTSVVVCAAFEPKHGANKKQCTVFHFQFHHLHIRNREMIHVPRSYYAPVC